MWDLINSKDFVITSAPWSKPILPFFAWFSVILVVPSFLIKSAETTTGTGSSLCPLMIHGVEWSAEIIIATLLESIFSTSVLKNRWSIYSIFFILPVASPSWPNSSGPLRWTYIAFCVSIAFAATFAFSS